MNTERCRHENAVQISTVLAKTYWTRTDETGVYEPDEFAGDVAIHKVVSEETESFECADCGAPLHDRSDEDGIHLEAEDDD